MAIPEFPSKTVRTSPLVQMCHGTPGLLYLLAQARKNDEFFQTYWAPECDEAIRLGSERVWEEGLLSKGGGLFHGIAGNAWPWLALHDAFENDKNEAVAVSDGIAEKNRISGDYFLSKALAFLLEATKTQPFNTESDKYRMPDKPYSLYEGLAGTISAWAEACVILVARLRKMDLDKESGGKSWKEDELLQEHTLHELGFPTLGGMRVTGFL